MDSAPPLAPYRYGLFSVASLANGEGPWQRAGVEYFTDHCAQGGYVQGMCPAPSGTDLAYTLSVSPGVDNAFSLYSQPGNPAPPVAYVVTQGGAEIASGDLATGQEVTVTPEAGTVDLAFTLNGTTHTESFTAPLAAPANFALTFPSGATTHDKTVAAGPELAEGSDPFTVYTRAECNAVGFDDPRGMALTRLGLVEEREVEHFFSRYVLGAPDPRYPAGQTAIPIKQALGALEADAALYYAGAPTLHAPRWAQPYMEDRNLLQANADTGDVRMTGLDSRVAFGGGYFDNPFDPETPPTAGFWLVATGSVRGWRSAPFVNETFTTETNLRMALAERTYALDADCYRAAVLVTLEGEG